MSFPRYERYTDSGVEWLGQVPEHWEVNRLKLIADVFPSNVDKKEYADEIAVRLCNYTDVYYNDVITEGMELMKATASQEQVEKFTLRAGDTILTKDSETADDIAISAYVPRDLPGVVCGYHLSIARPKPVAVGAFIKRVFDAAYIRAQAEVAANGLTRVGLSQYALDNLLVAYPERNEQSQIALFLDQETAKIDLLIEEQRRLIELLKEKRQSVISYAVTKGLNHELPMKKSGIEWLGETPKHWKDLRIGAIFREVNDAGVDGLPILSVSIHHGVSDKQLDDEELERKVTRSDDQTKYKRVRSGDLVYNMMRAWQGGFGTVNVEGMVSPAYVVARPSKGYSSRFVEFLLRTPCAVEEMRRYSQGVTDFRLRLYWDKFKCIRLSMPPLSEQEDILAYIETKTTEFDRLTEVSERAISILMERRTALISAAVMGKIDVRSYMAKPVMSATQYSSGFAHQLLAAEILDRCNSQRMGRIKLQKLIHLCEYHGQVSEVQGDYSRKAAGPFDARAMAGISKNLKKQKWFEEVKEGERYVYRPLEKRGEHKKYLAHWQAEMPRIDEVLSLLGNFKTRECEIVSTLYAAWNDLLIDGGSTDDAAILHEASSAERWHKSKEEIAPERWKKALQWMKDQKLVPVGYGKHTRHTAGQIGTAPKVAHEPA
jgi:type I restriction enzyme S subunit